MVRVTHTSIIRMCSAFIIIRKEVSIEAKAGSLGKVEEMKNGKLYPNDLINSRSRRN